MIPIGLVYSIHYSTEVAIQKMIDASQRMIDVQSQLGGEAADDGELGITQLRRDISIKLTFLK